MARKWDYTGDVDLKYGGTFYDLSDPDAIEAVQVTDLDSAIGFDGAFMIKTGYIELPELDTPEGVAKFRDLLSVCGYTLNDAHMICDGAGGEFDPKSHDGLLLACDAYVGYRGLEDSSPATVVIGKEPADEFQGWQITDRLHGNTKLRNYVKQRYLS